MPEQLNKSELKVTKVGLFRYGFFGGMILALFYLVIFGSNISLAIVIAIGLAWIIFEQWVVFQAVIGIQRLLILILQSKQERVIKQPDNKRVCEDRSKSSG